MAKGDRCDLCNTFDNVVWCWLTPCVAATPEESIEKHLFWAEDPEWAVCQTCHDLILGGHRDTLRARALLHMRGTFLADYDPFVQELMAVEMRDHITDVHAMFWNNKTTYQEDS